MPLAIIAAFVFAFGTASLARAHDHAGHARHHEGFYMGLKQPGTSISCCNNRDCRPAEHRVTPNGIEFLIAGRWIMPPQSQLIQTDDSPISHWCGVNEHTTNPTTFCAIIPRPGV